MAFFTRVLVFSHWPLPSRSTCGRAGLARRVLLDAVEGLDRDLELVAALVAEHHQLARGAADLERLEPDEAADAVLLVDDQVADLEVAEVREERAQPAAAPACVEVHLLREDVAVGEHEQAGLGHLEAARERPHPRQDARTLADREALLAQDVREAVGAPGVAEEHDRRGARRAQIGRQPVHVARVARRRPRRQVQRFAGRLDLAHLEHGHLRQVGRERLGRDQRLADLGQQTLAAALAVFARPREERLGLLTHGLRLDHHHRAARQVLPRRHGRAGHERQQIDEPLRRQPALERVLEGRQLAPAREALVQHGGERREQRARREEVGERQRFEGFERRRRALRVRVEAAQALHVVAEELDPHGLVGVGREDVEDAAAPRHLAGRRHRILARVAAFVERFEQDLGQELVAHAHLEHARRQQVRREARPQQPEGRRDDGARALGAVQRRGAPGLGALVPRQAAEGGRARRRQRQHGALDPGGRGERAQVLRRLLDVALARHQHEERGLGEQQRQERPQRPREARELRTSPSRERLARLAGGGPLHERSEPGGKRHGRRMRSTIPEVERPGTSATRTTRPPAASTSARPTISSAPQSAPFTSTSGTSAFTTASGVSSS